MYHSIAKGDHFLSLDPNEFEREMRYLKDNNFKFLKLEDLNDIKGLPNKSVMITFDDGYEDNFLNATPILKKYNIPAIFFISTGLLGKEHKGMKVMDWEQIKKISEDALFEVGCHATSHKKLHKMERIDVAREIQESKDILEQRLNKNVRLFAYPNGRYNDMVLKVVEEFGFDFAFSVKPRRLDKGFDKLVVPRLGVDNFCAKFFKDMFKGGYSLYWRLRAMLK